jgi:hypothetical protein
MNNFFSIVNRFKLVVYTDMNSIIFIHPTVFKHPNIKVIIKPIEDLYHYQYKDFWIKNHEKNYLLKNRTSWQLHVVWSEKLWFVKETIEKQYFDTEYYGWCDIGYFRNKPNTLHTRYLKNWSNPEKIQRMDKEKIHYACISNDVRYLNYIENIVKNKGIIPHDQVSLASGFFILSKTKIDWWCEIYDAKLKSYFYNNKLVKDEQIIITDCVFSNKEHFQLYFENNRNFDNWFMFQRILF